MKKLKITSFVILVVALAIFALASCGEEAHVHNFKDATCTTPKTCECGATEGEALGHTIVTDAAVAPTCTETGLTAGEHCSVCDYKVEQTVVDAAGHDHEAVVTAPTCTEDGYTTYTCACGDTYIADEVDALDHDYEAVVTAPTCTTDGYTTYTCHCGDTYIGDTVPAKHNYNSDGICSCGAVINVIPEAGKGYVFGMLQGNLNKVYYLKGGMNGYYMDTTTNIEEALYIYIEETEGGFYAYCFVNGTKTYINMVVSGTHVNGAYQATASTVYTIDETSKTLIANIDGSDYWFGTRNDNTYTTVGPCKTSYNGFYCVFYYAHTHNFVEDRVVAPTCENDGYTEHKCSCGAVNKENIVAALTHIEGEWTVDTAPTCTEAGVKIITCKRDGCGKVLKTEAIDATGHTYIDGKCSCGVEDPNYAAHVHNYDAVVTAPTCTVAGYTTYTCACGDTYTGDETPVADHVDTNLDITCDYDGCTKRILPAADTKVSLFTANHMIIVSLSSNYYVEGVVTEIVDAKNGMFIIQDEAGDSILVRLPKDADGNAYSSWKTSFVVVGDTIQVYGKPSKNTGSPATEKAKIEGGVLTVLKHTHAFSDATCAEASVCACGFENSPALGHTDVEPKDGSCDRCGWNMNLVVSNIAIRTDAEGNGVLAEDLSNWVWTDGIFNVEIAKGTSSYTLYKTAKTYMQLKANNTFTVYNTTGATIKSVTIFTTNATQLANLEKAMAGLTFTKDEASLSITVELNSTENFTFSNVGSTTVYISGVEIVYEPVKVAE